MSRSANLTGMKIHYLTVLSKGDSRILNNGTEYRWLTRCDCGKEFLASTSSLKRIKSCGCHVQKEYIENLKMLIGIKRNFLIPLEVLLIDNRVLLKCKCDCGNIKNILPGKLTRDIAKSCGCAHLDASKKSIKLAHAKNTKHEPRIASAKHLWGRKYDDGCSFDKFLELSQLPCYYCGIEPYQIYKSSKFDNRCSENFKNNDTFVYNGLDRINSSLPHNEDNIVSSCGICNKFKLAKTKDYFYNWIRLINIKDYNVYVKMYNELYNKLKFIAPLERSLASVHNRTYSELDYNYFYFLSQQNCFYCNKIPSSDCNGIKYTGIDRISCEYDHSPMNIVPACKECNFAKVNYDIEFFFDKVYAIKQFNNLF